MKREISVDWIDGLAFETDIDGHKITIDGPEESGGKNRGTRPKPLMLLALAGCTGMDVVSILKKMKVDVKGLNIRVEGDMEEELPKTFLSMHVVFTFKGDDLPVDKLERAVELSREKYCGVSLMLKKIIPITYEIKTESV
ncbi:MAG: OsmC family protein [Bacteroidales bacterium]|nr:OsmC family protein [Bacteroidales bacterium]